MTAEGNKMKVRMYWRSTVVEQELSQICLICVGFLHRGLPWIGLKTWLSSQNFNIAGAQQRGQACNDTSLTPLSECSVLTSSDTFLTRDVISVLNTLWWIYTYIFFFHDSSPYIFHVHRHLASTLSCGNDFHSPDSCDKKKKKSFLVFYTYHVILSCGGLFFLVSMIPAGVGKQLSLCTWHWWGCT